MIKTSGTAAAGELVSAAGRGDLESVKRLLAEGVHPDSRDQWNDFPLISAARFQRYEIMKVLLTSGANPSLTTRNNSGLIRSALHHAATLGPGPAVDLLLEHQASPRVRDEDGKTPAHYLMLAWQEPSFVLRIADGIDGEDLIKTSLGRMLDMGMPINQADEAGWTIFGTAVSGRAPTSVLAWLLDRGADPNVCADKGQGSIHVAAANNDVALVRWLAERGASVNKADNSGRTPLFCDWSDAAVGRELLTLGADLEHRDLDGRTVLGMVLLFQPQDSVAPETAFLIEAGADLDAPDFQGITPRTRIVDRSLTAVAAFISSNAARRAMISGIAGKPQPR